MLSDTSTQLL